MEMVSAQELKARINEAIEYVGKIDLENAEVGKYMVNDNFYYMVQDYESRLRENCKLEAHKNYVDVQWIIKGEEIIGLVKPEGLTIKDDYNPEKDVMFYNFPEILNEVVLTSGSYVVILPEEAHMPCCSINDKPANVKKVVIKVKAVK